MHTSAINSSPMPTLRPPSSSLAPPQQYHVTFIFFLTLLSFSLASFAFLLQWRGHDHHLIFSDNNQNNFPEMMTTSSDHNPVVTSGFDCADILGQSRRFVFPYFRDWKLNYDGADLNPKISIITSTSAGLEQTLPWIFYHKVVGVSNFYVFVEGKAATPNGVKVLKSIPGVKVIPRTKELDEEQAKSRIWNETWLASFFYRPCNYELFVKQSLNMEMGIAMARDSGMDWIIHLDTDELAYPIGTSDFSLTQLFSKIPERFDTVVFPNFESAVERDDIKEPFSEVSLFKKNFDRLAREIYFGSYKEAARGNPNYFLTYGNGKSAARIRDHLRPNGAHRWSSYRKRAVETKLEEAVVLHYTYPKFSDLTSRRDRCKCKPTKEEVQRCFILQFDRVAFIIASTSTDEEMLLWYREHVVWSDIKLKLKLLNKGILTRIYEPMIIIQTLKESGVFSSVIASSQSAEESEDHESVSSVESSNNNSTRIGQELVNLQANARKILEISTGFGIYNEEMAAPPLSPPTPGDFVASNMYQNPRWEGLSSSRDDI